MKSQGIGHGKKVFVGVSGGVDSSVALAFLQDQGYEVTGVFLKVWNPDWMECNWREERRSAMRVCATLGVPFMTLDCEAEYKKEVIDYMIREYSLGRVPNPDIFCNKYVKFGVFLDKALTLGADFIATGHYAQVVTKKSSDFVESMSIGEAPQATAEDLREFRTSENPYSPMDMERKKSEFFYNNLQESTDTNKDQSYFLYTLNQHQLSHTLFPVGHLTKPEVRKLAEKFGLPTATKKDSQGLCFIGKVDMKEFLSHYIQTTRGDVLDTEGQVIGYHDGALLYAIGERHGFTITHKTPHDPRFFVVSKNIEQNTITVADISSPQTDEYSVNGVIVRNFHFISGLDRESSFETSVRIRYRQEKQTCTVSKMPDGYHVVFAIPQKGVSLGQSAVFYDGDVCIGGGIIDATL